MADLTPIQVQALLNSLGLKASQEDLPEITYRVNAAQEVLAALEYPDLDSIEPLPVFWLQEDKENG